MQTTINKKDFINALTIGGAMASKNKTLPILDFAKVEVESDTLSVHSFNGETWVSKSIKIDGTSVTGSFCINPSELVKALKTLAEEIITFTIEGNVMCIGHIKGTMEMPIAEASAFPTAQVTDEGVNVNLSVDKLKEWLSNASDFVAQDDLRPVMQGLYLYAKDGILGVCATDAHKLWHDTMKCDCNDFGVILPSSSFKPLLSMLDGSNEIATVIGVKNISFMTTDSALHCRLIEGNYPNFQAVIPQSNSIEVKVHKGELVDSVSRVGLFANKTTSLLKLLVNEEVMGLEGSDINFSRKAIENVKVDSNGSLNIGVKGDFFSVCLSHILSDDVVLKMSGDNRPIVFSDNVEPNKVILVMPMLIQ
jgi:DNA polymerase-3 subunit beta